MMFLSAVRLWIVATKICNLSIISNKKSKYFLKNLIESVATALKRRKMHQTVLVGVAIPVGTAGSRAFTQNRLVIILFGVDIPQRPLVCAPAADKLHSFHGGEHGVIHIVISVLPVAAYAVKVGD